MYDLKAKHVSERQLCAPPPPPPTYTALAAAACALSDLARLQHCCHPVAARTPFSNLKRPAGRDLSFLLGSYAANAGLTLGLLYTLTQRQWGITGIWVSLLTFQVRIWQDQLLSTGACASLLLAALKGTS